MNINWIQKLKIALASLALLGLTACGGAGGGGGGIPSNATDTNTGTATATINNGVVTIPATQLGLVSTKADAAGATVLVVSNPAQTALANAQVGTVVNILPGQDSRYPLGLAGVVESVSINAQGQKEITLKAATLADVVSQSKVKIDAIPLSAENFVGVIAPDAVTGGGSTTPRQVGLLNQGVTALNGALTIGPSKSNSLMTGASVLNGGSIAAGEIALSLSKPLKAFSDDPSKIQPYGTSAEAKLNVSFKFTDLKLTENHEFETVVGIPYKLKSMELKLDGKVEGALNITGGADAALGFYSQAWKEVEKSSIELLGSSATLTGLDGKDKVGKFPLVGLVFSVPCSATISCPVTFGATQTPLRQAQAGGVIVWVYLTADGRLKFEGTVGARSNGNLALGINQPVNGSVDGIFSMSRSGDKNLIEAPYFDGSVDASTKMGFSVDVDSFALGVRFANASVFLGGSANLNGKLTVANVLPDLGQEWRWVGDACFQTSVGAGAIFSAQVKVGAEIQTAWDKVAGTLEYKVQSPKSDDMILPGAHNVLALPLWYTWKGVGQCFPQPIATKLTATNTISNGTVTAIQWDAVGTHLPDDLTLNVLASGVCSEGNDLAMTVAADKTSAIATCTMMMSIGGFNLDLTSLKASNMDTSQVYKRWDAPAVPALLAITSITPPAIMRTVQGNFTVSGKNLPISGLTVTVPADSRAVCQAPTAMTATGFNVSCNLNQMGNAILEVHNATQLLGTVTVNVTSNVTDVNWATPSTGNVYGKASVQFGEAVTYQVTGVNLTSGMGFAVVECGTSNVEIGVGTSTLRTFTCNFNNQAGATAGQKSLVVKDVPIITNNVIGQVLYRGQVPVAVTGQQLVGTWSGWNGSSYAAAEVMQANGYITKKTSNWSPLRLHLSSPVNGDDFSIALRAKNDPALTGAVPAYDLNIAVDNQFSTGLFNADGSEKSTRIVQFVGTNGYFADFFITATSTGNPGWLYQSGVVVDTKIWHDYILSSKNNVVKLYVDGILIHSQTYTGTIGSLDTLWLAGKNNLQIDVSNLVVSVGK